MEETKSNLTIPCNIKGDHPKLPSGKYLCHSDQLCVVIQNIVSLVITKSKEICSWYMIGQCLRS